MENRVAKKHYTFTFAQYQHERMERVKELLGKRYKLRLKVLGFGCLFTLIVGNIYPLMMWFQYDMNIYKPRMTEYLKNRFK